MARPLIRMLLAWCLSAAAAADGEPERPLSLEEVLEASARHYPEVVAALAERQVAVGEFDARLGDFDTVFSMESFGRLSGFYDGRVLETSLERPLGRWGSSLYGGYSISRGDFPVYEDAYYTNTGGRLKVGVLFSLLRDRATDERRVGLADARLGVRQAHLEVAMVRIGVQRRAIEAFWRWVVAGRKRSVYAELLDLAQVREEGLVDQVERGARAAIELTDNRRNIVRRRALVLAAEAELQRTGYRLSLYFRDGAGQPRLPAEQSLPSDLGTEPMPAALPELPGLLAVRPELRRLRVAAERARQQLALAENALQPRMDLSLEVSEPFGAVGEGGPSRDTTDTVLAVTVTVPLARRSERAGVRQSQAELRALEARTQALSEQLVVEINDLLVELDLAGQLAGLAERELEQARRLVVAENRRFQVGSSDFFLVNLREEDAASAEIGLLDAQLRSRLARADFDAAVMDFARLGLSGQL